MKWWKVLIFIVIFILIFATIYWYYNICLEVKEGFDANQNRLASYATVYPSNITTTDSSDNAVGTVANPAKYTIFDPSAAYLQANIYAQEIALPLMRLYSTETNFTNTVLPKLLDNTLKRSELTQDILRNIANNGVGSSINAKTTIGKRLRELEYVEEKVNNEIVYFKLKDPESYYKTRDLLFMRNYNLTQEFKNNPVRFIVNNIKPNTNSFINCGYRPLQLDKIIAAQPITGNTDTGYDKYLSDFGRPAILSNIHTRLRLQHRSNYKYNNNTDNIKYPSNLFDIYEIMSYVAPQLSYRDSGDTSNCYPNKTVDTVISTEDTLVGCDQYLQIEGWLRQRDDGSDCWEDAACRTWTDNNWDWNNGGYVHTVCDGQAKVKKRNWQRKGDIWMKFPCTQTHASKQCATIPGEKDGTESINPGPGIPTSILTNPQSWSLKSFMKNPSNIVKSMINDFVRRRGITDKSDDSNYSGNKLLYKTVNVIGTISADNKTEIRNSILYSMYFNFTDPSTTSQQIYVESSAPCDLYMFPDASGIEEFTYLSGATNLNQAAVTKNQTNRIKMTDAMLKVLPYHTRDHIRRWAIARRTRLTAWYAKKCSDAQGMPVASGNFCLQSEVTNGTDSLPPSPPNNSTSRIDAQKLYCCPLNPNTAFSGTNTINCTYQVYTSASSNALQLGTRTVEHTCANTTQINKRNYNETFGDPASLTATADIAPKFNMMSSPITAPSVYIVKSANSFTPSITADTENPGTYINTLTIDTSQEASTFFLTFKDIYVNVMSLTNSTNSYGGQIKAYSNGTLNLKNISANSVFINGTITPTATSFSLPNDYYTVSYTDNTALTQESTNILTATAITINPTTTANSTVELQVPLNSNLSTLFPVDTNVLVTNNSVAGSNFRGKISSVNTSSSQLYAKITITNITDIRGTFTAAAVYAILLIGTSAPTHRIWLTTQEKKQILNMIAQKYYELNNGTKKIQTIFDIYQVGDTIFDIRFSTYGRITEITRTTQEKIVELTRNYRTYRTYNLSNDQIVQLDDSYTNDMIKLNSDLDNAVLGTGTGCGVRAQYVVIQRTDINLTNTKALDTDLSGIHLSQVIVVDNTGNNAALNTFVTPTSTFVYSFEATNLYVFVSPPNCTIQSDGSIKDSGNNIVAIAGTCKPVIKTTTPYTASNCDIAADNTISVKRATTNTNDNAEIRSIKINRNQSLVDGEVYKNELDQYNTRVMPYYFRTGSPANRETVTIDLGNTTDIVTVRLVFPAGYTDTPKYQVTLLDSMKNTISENGDTSISVKIERKAAGSDTLDINYSKIPAVANCPTDLLNPYLVARFYATISTSFVAGNPTNSLAANSLQFTGYSIGVDAALTFNPMYNAGFILNTANGSGNMNYNPVISYTLNVPLVDQTDTTGKLCDNNTDNGKFLINIMRDYMSRIPSNKFLSRADVAALNYYNPINYSYNVTMIKGAAKIVNSAETYYAINWLETPRNLSNNTTNSPIERWGKFVYTPNKENWAANDVFYDITKSVIYTSAQSGVNYTTCNIPVPDLLPVETDSLDNIGGVCPSAKCSDTNVINQLVQQFNDISGSKHNTQILRVTKAVTVSPTQCDYEVYMQEKNTNPPTTEKKNISMNLSVRADANECKYIWDRSDILDETAGKFIQSNTPSLLHVFNYVSEVMKPYIDKITDIQTNLTGLVNANTINTDYANYLGDTYGAYGQIKDLSGCSATDNEAGKAKCYTPIIMNEFMKAYNNANKGSSMIQRITHAGTASNTECDYVVSLGTITSINGSTATIGLNGTTRAIRAKMKKSTSCYFSVDTTSTNNGLQNNTLPMSIDMIRTLKPVALNRPPWTVPITLGTQNVIQVPVLNLTNTSTTIQLRLEPSNYYKVNTAVTVVDMKDSNNSFNAIIGAYVAPNSNSSGLAILTLNNITAVRGRFNTPTKYTIRAIPPNGVTANGINPVETVDYVDCTSAYVNDLLTRNGVTSIGQITNLDAVTCQTNGRQYRFSTSSDPKINSLRTVTTTTGTTGNISNTRTLTNSTKTTVSSMTSATAYNFYSSIDTNTPCISVSTNIWDFRINISDTLPFGDTYKRIRFYRDAFNNIRIDNIEDAPPTSKFAFFQNNPISDSSIQTAIANAARDWWNKQYATATAIQNKIIIGNITDCYYDSTNDLIVLVAKACDYGIYGATDIRSNPSTRYFSTQLRRIYNSLTLIYNRNTPNSNTIFVYSMTEIEAIPTGLVRTTFTNSYSALPQDITNGYDPTKSLIEVLTVSKAFRYLRFSVEKTPISNTSANTKAHNTNGSGGGGGTEILQMNFYKNKNNVLDSTKPLIFNYASYSVDGMNLKYYDIYSTENIVTKDPVIITPVISQSLTITIPKTQGFVINDSVIVYNTATAQNYFLGTISAITATTLTINCTFIYGIFTSAVKYTVAINKCAPGYTASSDPYLLSYMKCTLTNPVTYNMITTTYSDGGRNYNLPCSIGFTKSGNTCSSTGIYSNVITQNLNMNLAVPRLQLDIRQHFNISLNDTVTINYFNFTTGVANTRPQQWILEGSMCGLDGAKYWVPLHTQASDYTYDTEVNSTRSVKTASGNNIYSFVTTNYFPLLSSNESTANINNFGTNKNYLFDPSISSSTPIRVNSIAVGSSTYVENFQNPSILHKTSNPKFRQQVPNLENSYKVPLEQPISRVPAQMQIQNERRIQFLRIKILSTRKNTGSIHMSNLQFVTPLGILPTSHYKISNPMGIHPTRNNGPDALSNGGVWIISNNEPLLIKFNSLPQVVIEGFQFIAPNVTNPFDSLPATWLVEGSYDGRLWAVYNETLVPQNFASYNSPVYKFLKDI